MKELERRGFIAVTSAPGAANTVTLLDTKGTGQPYRRPDGASGGFFRVPEQLWTTGTISRLSGPGLVMYLILLYYHRRPDNAGQDPFVVGGREPLSHRPIWFSAKSFHERHGLSEDTRLAGIQDLQDAGIIHVDAVSVDSMGGDSYRRFRRRLLTLTAAFEPPIAGVAPGAAAVTAAPPPADSEAARLRRELRDHGLEDPHTT